MRYFGTDKGQNNYLKVDQNLIRTCNDGDLTPREVWMIKYFGTHKSGYRVGTKQIAEDSGLGQRTVQRTINSLEEKGYLYRNKANRHPRTGPEFIVAETPELLQKIIESENLFEPKPEPKDSETEPKKTESSQPTVPEELLDQFNLGGQDWIEMPHRPRPALFARPPLRETSNARGKMPEKWRIYVSYHADEALGATHVSHRYAPSFFGIPVRHMCHGGVTYMSRRDDPVRHICHPHYRITKNTAERLKRITTLKLLRICRLSNVRRHPARVLAKVNSNSSTSNEQKTPDLDRSHNRRWVRMFDRKDGHPYHGIRAYVEDDQFSPYKPTLKDDLSIYWFNPDAEWEEGVLPTKPEELPDITERPLDEGADPRAAPDVPGRYSDVGLLAGKNDPHPHDRSFRSKVAIKALGATIFGGIEISVKEGPCPWPEPNPEPDRELSFAGHRPEDQPAEIKKAGSYVTSTKFIRMAKEKIEEAMADEKSGYEDIPQEPSPIDHERAEEYGKDPEAMMLLRQVAEVIISPHVFDIENTYESPGRDPWPIRMYSKLAFPETDLSVEGKIYIDKKVTQAHPSSPAQWAEILLHGLEKGWNPRWVKNFVKCYRHKMHIEPDPNRDPAPGGPRTSQGEIRRGNGIDLSQGDPKEIIPPKD